jgi:hypothetical protein
MAEHIHRWIAAAAVFVVATGFLGWRALGSSDPRKPGLTLATPDPQLAPLFAYSAPLADTIRILGMGDAAITLRQDPFGRHLIAPADRGRSPVSSVAAVPRVVDVDSPHWQVTATLMNGSRRAAVINDELIYLGDSVPGGGKLTAVERDRVTVTDARGASHTVAVKEGED